MKNFLFIFILFPLAVFSQKSWDLQQCIEHAIANNISIKQSENRVDAASLQMKQAKNNRLPGLNASLSDGFSFGRSLSNSNVYVNQNSNSANASIGVDVPIFQGLKLSNEIAARNFDFMASVQDHQKIKNDIALNIASYYLNVLVQKELLKIAQQQLLLTDTLLFRCEVLVKNGKETISKLYELKAQYANEEFSITNAQKNLNLSLLDLAQILELEKSSDFDIPAPNFDFDIAQMVTPGVNFENTLLTLPNVKAEELRLESSRKNLEIVKGSYYPSVSMSASTSTGYYHLYNNAIPSEAFGTQISNNLRSYMGLSLNIPIFSRLAIKSNISQSKISIQRQELEVENSKKTLYKDIQRAMLNAKVSKDRYAAATKSVHANQESLKYVEQRYNTGRGTLFELQQSKLGLEKALSEQIQAKYEFIFNSKVLDFYNGLPIK